MKPLLGLLCLLLLFGCTGTITVKPDGTITAVDYNVSATYSQAGKPLSLTALPFKRFDFNISEIMAGVPGIINALPKPVNCPACPSCPPVVNPVPVPAPVPVPDS